ncbi:GAF domain-containing protein [Nocardia sp. NPDC046473]|uniref:GAF domain-containing protein n=1 Tax=Nocardia sp. NPDC046473 TaxID=3155733 RepID=UPI00340A6304
MTWYLVECLGLSSMSIVAKDGVRKEWVSIFRIERDEGVDAVGALNWARSSGSHLDQRMSGRFGDRRIEIVPILGPEDDVYAMHLWIGDPSTDAPKPRPAAGLRWNLGELQVQQRLESWLMSTNDASAWKGIRSPGEIFRKVLRFDDIPQLIEIANSPTPDAQFESSLCILHDDGHLMNWQIMARGRNDERHVGVRALTHDVTDIEPPVVGPFETLRLTNEDITDGPAAALLAFGARSSPPTISSWIGKVPTWIDWQRDGDPALIHPDSWPALRRTQALLEPACPTIEMTTRARIRANTDTGWQTVDITSRRYPGEVGRILHIIRITKADDNSNPQQP